MPASLLRSGARHFLGARGPDPPGLLEEPQSGRESVKEPVWERLPHAKSVAAKWLQQKAHGRRPLKLGPPSSALRGLELAVR